MRRTSGTSPTRLALLGVGGLVSYVLGIGLCFLLRFDLPIHRGHWESASAAGHFRVLLAFAMVLLGVGFTVGTVLRMASGIKNGRWTDGELEPLRRKLQAPMWKFLYAGIFVLLVAGFILLPQNSAARSLGYFAFFPLQMLASVATSLRKEDDPPSLVLGGGSNPIRSEHWGKE